MGSSDHDLLGIKVGALHSKALSYKLKKIFGNAGKVARHKNHSVAVCLNCHSGSGDLGLNKLGDSLIELSCETYLFFGNEGLLAPTYKKLTHFFVLH